MSEYNIKKHQQIIYLLGQKLELRRIWGLKFVLARLCLRLVSLTRLLTHCKGLYINFFEESLHPFIRISKPDLKFYLSWSVWIVSLDYNTRLLPKFTLLFFIRLYLLLLVILCAILIRLLLAQVLYSLNVTLFWNEVSGL